MPRTSLGGVTSAFERIQRQARTVLGGLRGQIRAKENELQRLKQEEARLSNLLGSGGSARRTATTAAPVSGAGRGRINWREVLKQMPKQFKASDVRRVRGLKAKRPSEIFAAITRWIDAGLAKRKKRGIYERS
jgi:cell shape-determining protein MreC